MKRDLNFTSNKPLLYVIATPIGNLDEFSERAKKTVEEMDFIACEDTRVSGKLLSLFGFKKQFISCHEHNEKEAGTKIIELLKEGKKVAYMSDAGYPSISDPGQKLIELAIENEINVSVINGPSAMINALVGSGLDSGHFYFQGFLEAKESTKKEQLQELASRKETIIFYESPHRIESTLKLMYKYLGNRKACIARELTKLHEEFIRGSLEEFANIPANELIGEMVIVVEGNKNSEKEAISDEEIINMITSFINEGMSAKDAIKKTAEITKISKNQIYNLYHN